MATNGSFADYVADRLRDPVMRAAYEDANNRRALVQDLITRRKELGVSQKQVAERMGVKQPTISGFEVDDSDPRLSTLQRYARAINACLSVDLHVQGSDGAWKRDVIRRAWRASVGRTVVASVQSNEADTVCKVISLSSRYVQSAVNERRYA